MRSPPTLGGFRLRTTTKPTSEKNHCEFTFGIQHLRNDAIDRTFAFTALNDIETGLVYINASTIGAEIQLPFGGVKGTGNGHRDAGQTMIENCTEWKSIGVDYSGTVQKAQIDH